MEKLNFAGSYNEIGQIEQVGPANIFVGKSNLVEINDEISNKLLEGTLHLSSLLVKFDNDIATVHIIDTKSTSMINNLLYRINPTTDLQHDTGDLTIKIDVENSSMKVSLRNPELVSRGMISPDKEILLLITEFNDPNALYEICRIRIGDLATDTVYYEGLTIPKHFDLYTKRIFRDYRLEII